MTTTGVAQDRGLIGRLHAVLEDTKAALAEDARLRGLMENVERRARELIEQRRMLEAQVWLAGAVALAERRQRTRLAGMRRQDQRIASLVETIGNGSSARGFGSLLSAAAAVQPDLAGELLDVIEHALMPRSPGQGAAR